MKKNCLIALVLLLLCHTYSYAQFEARNLPVGSQQYVLALAHTDWNNDGLPDVMIGGYVGTRATLYVQNKKGTYTNQIVHQDAWELGQILVADFDQDTKQDALLLGQKIVCLLGDGKNGVKKEILIQDAYCSKTVLIDFNEDGLIDIASSNGQGLLLIANKGKGAFEKMPQTLPATAGSDIHIADIDQDGRQDLVTVGEALAVYWNKGKGNFEQEIVWEKKGKNDILECLGIGKMGKYQKMCLVLRTSTDQKADYHFLQHKPQNNNKNFETTQVMNLPPRIEHILFQDIDKNGVMDMAVMALGEISLVLNPLTSQQWVTQKIADTQGAPKNMLCLPTNPQEIAFYYTNGGENYQTYGLFRVALPAMAVMPLAQSQAFVGNEKAFAGIKAHLQKIYNWENASNVFVFKYAQNQDRKTTYGFQIEGNDFLFDEAGKLLESSLPTLPKQPRYLPLGGKAKFVEEKKDAYSTNIAQEFLQKYHAGKTFKTYHDKNAYTYSQFKFERNIDQNTTEEVYMGFQNYSDGLQWNFWTYTLKRHTQNPFAVVGKAEVAEKIKAHIKDAYNIADNNLPDVFEYVYDNFQTSQRSENLDFPERKPATLYGVYAQNKLYLFDLNGNFVKVE